MSIETKSPVKQAHIKKVERDKKGRLLPGSTANPNGRPPAGLSIQEIFRDHKDAKAMIDKLYKIAGTIDSDKPHKDAMAALKTILERQVPSLRAQEIHINEDDKSFIYMPAQKEPDSDD